jgi:hypothetical protein
LPSGSVRWPRGSDDNPVRLGRLAGKLHRQADE